MDTIAKDSAVLSLGARVRQARTKQGLTQDQLAQPQFTKSYISAIEHNRVKPSLKALDFLARRLGISTRELLSDQSELDSAAPVEAAAQEQTFQLDRAEWAINLKQAREALALLDAAEQISAEAESGPTAAQFRLNYLRGQTFLLLDQDVAAQRELQRAITLAEKIQAPIEELIKVRNFLGLAYFKQEQPQLALEEHRPCHAAISAGQVTELRLKLQIYTNLARDYVALGELDAAAEVYAAASNACDNAANLERQAALNWSQAQRLWAAGATEQARAVVAQANQLFVAEENMRLATQLTIDRAALYIAWQQFDQAEAALTRAHDLLGESANAPLLGTVYLRFTEMKLQQGQLEQAAIYSQQSLELLGAPHKVNSAAISDQRPYITALQMAGRVAEAQHDRDGADEYFRQALALTRAAGDHVAASSIARNYADLLSARNMHQEAVAYYHEALNYLRQQPADLRVGSLRGRERDQPGATEGVNAAKEPPAALAQLIRVAREERGLSIHDLGAPELSVSYCAALETGAIVPSAAVLQLLAPRLGLEYEQLLNAPRVPELASDLAAVAEDIAYQGNLALALIRGGQPAEGLAQADQLEAYARPYAAGLTPASRYLAPYLRGRACYGLDDLARAQLELEHALALASGDTLASTTVHNLLGLIDYDQEHPDSALAHHLQCLPVARDKANRDFNLRVSVLRNTANDYLVLGDTPMAIALYREALKLLEDLDDPERTAAIHWGLMMAYRSDGNLPQALLNGARALNIYEARDRRDYAAMVSLNLVELLLEGQRYADAEEYLNKAGRFLQGSTAAGPFSFLNADLAELALRRSDLQGAAEYAAQAISFAEANLHLAQASRRQLDHANHVYAFALQIAALVEVARGVFERADEYFERALALINTTSMNDAKAAINESYARALSERGAFERSLPYYQKLADLRPRLVRSRTF